MDSKQIILKMKLFASISFLYVFFYVKGLLMLTLLSPESCYDFSCPVLVAYKLAAYKKGCTLSRALLVPS